MYIVQEPILVDDVHVADNLPGNLPGAAAPVPEDPQKREAVGPDGPVSP